MRCGTVAVIGRSNVGKSTFANLAVGEHLAIVSPRPQTTRELLLGVVHLPDAQLALLDTPGLHWPKNELGRRMNALAWEAARSGDVILFMTDIGHPISRSAREPRTALAALHQEDQKLLLRLEGRQPAVVVLNKVDTLRDKSLLLPLMGAWAEALPDATVIPASMLRADDVERILGRLRELVPEGRAGYEPDELTDRPAEFFVREFVREQFLLSTRGEVPHAVAVSIDELSEHRDLLMVKVTVHVEKVGQRKILIGRGGQRIREVGQAARQALVALLGRRVHLELFVRVSPRWRNVPRQLEELGYQEPEDSRRILAGNSLRSRAEGT